uniref:Homeobox domain-containing protein n=2 Tax=Oryza TaxID=4527 RepID=A0A0E0NQ47_ORYRU
MATFFSSSTNQRDFTGGGGDGGDMSFQHYPPPSNPYSDSSAGGLIPLPASIVSHSHIAHGGGDEPAAFREAATADGGEMGLQTQLLMAHGAAARGHQGGLSLSLGTQVPVSLYQYRPAGMAAASLLSPSQSSPMAGRSAQNSIYVQNSRFLRAARELLDEVVNVRDAIKRKGDKNQGKDSGECKGGDAAGDDKAGSNPQEQESNSAPELSPSERQDLQNKVTALMAMLDQVDRRYRHYHHQMQIVMSSFDAVAGGGAARPYTALALQTISRHFRSLRDAIGAQAQAARRGLGEQDASAQGGGGLSRLRYIDQQLRQQRAMQQFGMMQQPQHAWRPQRGLPESAVSVLRAWLFEHFLHPYPKDSEKLMLARQTGLSRGQVSNWFINARVRLWKPMIEEMYKEEFGAEMDSNSSSENGGGGGGKGKDEAISSEDRDEFQSPSSAAAARHAGVAGQLNNPFKSEAMGGAALDVGVGVVGLSSCLGGAMGTYATGLNLNHHVHHPGAGGTSLLHDALHHHHHGGGGDARFVSYGDMADLGGGGGYDGGSVSLTLGLQHCNNAGPVPAEQQGLLYGSAGDFDYINGSDDRQRFGPASQLLHDFVA